MVMSYNWVSSYCESASNRDTDSLENSDYKFQGVIAFRLVLDLI